MSVKPKPSCKARRHVTTAAQAPFATSHPAPPPSPPTPPKPALTAHHPTPMTRTPQHCAAGWGAANFQTPPRQPPPSSSRAKLTINYPPYILHQPFALKQIRTLHKHPNNTARMDKIKSMVTGDAYDKVPAQNFPSTLTPTTDKL